MRFSEGEKGRFFVLMGKLILILGGARSGKSRFAGNLACKFSKKIIYIAAAQALDEEMIQRIAKHKKNRSKNWKTIEEPKDLERIKRLLTKSESGVKRSLPEGDKVILFECLTLWVSNFMHEDTKGLRVKGQGLREKEIIDKIKNFIKFLRKEKKTSIFVSNEVGCGIVPDNSSARDFRDIQGRVNQLVAELADEVYFVVAGIGVKIK